MEKNNVESEIKLEFLMVLRNLKWDLTVLECSVTTKQIRRYSQKFST